ncbi:MAG: hypothetical protein AAFQ85_07450 [Pseudomonadota bacterium]
MDIEAYRKNLTDQIEALSGDLQRSTGLSARGSQSAVERATSVAEMPLNAQNLNEIVPMMLEISVDRNEPVTVRLEAIQKLQSADFFGPAFDPFRSDFNGALRQCAMDESPTLRSVAAELLSLEGDPWIADRLRDSLQESGTKLVPDALALKYLGYDDHSGAPELALELYEDLDTDAKEQALRLLDGSELASKILQAVVTDAKAAPRLRTVSAYRLSSLAPDVFIEHAVKVLEDDEEAAELKVAYLAALKPSAAQGAADQDALNKVAAALAESKSSRLRAAVENYEKRIEKTNSPASQ